MSVSYRILYKFVNSKSWECLSMETASVSASDVKRAIIERKKISKSRDAFTLELSNPQIPGHRYEDTDVIPRNATLLVRRVPMVRGETIRLDDAAKEAKESAPLPLPILTSKSRVVCISIPPTVGPTPPPGYVCHTCHVPGHLIRFCPVRAAASLPPSPLDGAAAASHCEETSPYSADAYPAIVLAKDDDDGDTGDVVAPPVAKRVRRV